MIRPSSSPSSAPALAKSASRCSVNLALGIALAIECSIDRPGSKLIIVIRTYADYIATKHTVGVNHESDWTN